jgi:hypothetical protein
MDSARACWSLSTSVRWIWRAGRRRHRSKAVANGRDSPGPRSKPERSPQVAGGSRSDMFASQRVRRDFINLANDRQRHWGKCLYVESETKNFAPRDDHRRMSATKRATRGLAWRGLLLASGASIAFQRDPRQVPRPSRGCREPLLRAARPPKLHPACDRR